MVKNYRHRAFTLLELVVALAVAAVVAAFALPSWHAQIARGHRVDAVAALYRAAQFVDTQSASTGTLPAGFDQSPSTGAPVYRLRLMPADDSNGGYAIAAEPVETGPMRDDACGAYVLDATGVRRNQGVGGSAAEAVVQTCWKDR
ncbi:type IV pilus assembly protein PilE [Paraburkholderia unamae]|nr:type IV pilin protein [Paraburkholderia unamae]RAR58766.1 type IV pilus assembly protein PilE [Paraburkholderia unamae]